MARVHGKQRTRGPAPSLGRLRSQVECRARPRAGTEREGHAGSSGGSHRGVQATLENVGLFSGDRTRARGAVLPFGRRDCAGWIGWQERLHPATKCVQGRQSHGAAGR